MGRDLTLYPKSASKDDLKMYLENLGFKKCKHFWDWPKGTLNYSWFDVVDFRSITGVSADIYPVFGQEKSISGNEWALHVRNTFSASWHDVNMLNEVLRGARKLFGGTIRGDYGTNKYAPLWDDESTPLSRGVSAVYQRVTKELEAIKFALPKERIQPIVQKHDDARMTDFAELVSMHDPVRVLYNGLVPFAVSLFEFYFARVFNILISYDIGAREKLTTINLKVEFDTLLAVSNKKLTVEDVITEKYTFQNLDQLNKAYKEWLGIDVRHVLFKKKRIGRSITFLQNRIFEIIQYRHGVIHHLELDLSLTEEDYIAILDAVLMAIKEFTAYIEVKYKVSIERD